MTDFQCPPHLPQVLPACVEGLPTRGTYPATQGDPPVFVIQPGISRSFTKHSDLTSEMRSGQTVVVTMSVGRTVAKKPNTCWGCSHTPEGGEKWVSTDLQPQEPRPIQGNETPLLDATGSTRAKLRLHTGRWVKKWLDNNVSRANDHTLSFMLDVIGVILAIT